MAALTDDEIHKALVASAAEVFASEGFRGARMQTIAERAGLSTGAIYNRFTGKSELLLEALRTYSDDLLSEHAKSDNTVADFISQLADRLLARSQGLGSALLLEALLAARREPEIATWLRPRIVAERERLSGMVEEDHLAGLIDPSVDIEAVITFSQAVSLGMQMMNAVAIDMPERDSWNNMISTVIAAVARPKVTD